MYLSPICNKKDNFHPPKKDMRRTSKYSYKDFSPTEDKVSTLRCDVEDSLFSELGGGISLTDGAPPSWGRHDLYSVARASVVGFVSEASLISFGSSFSFSSLRNWLAKANWHWRRHFSFTGVAFKDPSQDKSVSPPFKAMAAFTLMNKNIPYC